MIYQHKLIIASETKAPQHCNAINTIYNFHTINKDLINILTFKIIFPPSLSLAFIIILTRC